MSEIKITQEELDQINLLKERIRTNVEAVGRLNIKKHFLEMDLKQVQEELVDIYEDTENLSAEERRIVSEITGKYGDGELDFQTGIYTPKQ